VLRPFVPLIALTLLAAPAAHAASVEVTSGPSRAVATDAPWSVEYGQRRGETLREERRLAYRDATVTIGERPASPKRWRYDRRTRTLTVIAKGATVLIHAA
jgi:hypothetical protein